MNGTSFLAKPVTRAELIGSLLTVPIVAWALVSLPSIYALPSKYAELFAPFATPLPTATRLFLQMGGTGLVSAFGLLVLAPVAVLLLGRRSWPKVAAPVVCGVAITLLMNALVDALLEPVVQIMQSLHG